MAGRRFGIKMKGKKKGQTKVEKLGDVQRDILSVRRAVKLRVPGSEWLNNDSKVHSVAKVELQGIVDLLVPKLSPIPS